MHYSLSTVRMASPNMFVSILTGRNDNLITCIGSGQNNTRFMGSQYISVMESESGVVNYSRLKIRIIIMSFQKEICCSTKLLSNRHTHIIRHHFAPTSNGLQDSSNEVSLQFSLNNDNLLPSLPHNGINM